jgi:uncharacterized protein YbaP (TraB family)
MKNSIKSILAIIAIVFSVTIKAQTKSPKLEKSLLWEVSGNGLSKPSYLYGTTHMICSADYFLAEKTKKAFDVSDKVVFEVNFSDPNEMKYAAQMVMGEKPLSKTLSTEELSKLDQVLKKNAGMTVQQVDAYSVLSVMSLISVKSFGCKDIKMYEMEFLEAAKKKNMPIGGLETFKSQEISAANAYSNLELISMLNESTAEESAQLVSDYKNEDVQALYESNTDKKVMNAKAKKYMLDDRNTNWVKQMPEMMKKESVFFAFGSAHLGGDLGVINLLREAGYQVKPITK